MKERLVVMLPRALKRIFDKEVAKAGKFKGAAVEEAIVLWLQKGIKKK